MEMNKDYNQYWRYNKTYKGFRVYRSIFEQEDTEGGDMFRWYLTRVRIEDQGTFTIRRDSLKGLEKFIDNATRDE